MLEQASSPIRIASTLIPLDGFNVLLPNACIDEVFFVENIDPIKQSPDWCVGATDFKGNKIIVISIESIENPNYTINKDKNLIIKIKKSDNYPNIPDFGILAYKTPNVVQANNHSLNIEYNPIKPHRLALSYVTIKDTQAIILDVNTLMSRYVLQC